LLRYAAAEGRPLGSWARKSLDAAFADRLRGTCTELAPSLDRVGCLVLAAVYSSTVSINSWRQAFGVPAAEPPIAVVGFVLGAVAAPTLGLVALRARRVRRR
jgi:hypothetical protein